MRYPTIDLRGAVVAVTGAARGIGLATAERFLGAGARVVLGDLDGDEVEAAALALGPRAFPAVLDVRDAASVATFAATAEAVGPTAVLVNNAGIMPVGWFLDEAASTTDQQLAVNVHGPINGMRAFLPAMTGRGRGHVVNVASMAGKIPAPGLAVYNATKFAVVGLSAAVGLEVAGRGVSVTAVLPSAVNTALVSGIPPIPGLPTVEPDDVAKAIVASCDHRRPEVHVPRYLGAWGLVSSLVPRRVLGAVRSRMGQDDYVERVDAAARAEYADRVRRQA